MTAVLEPQSNDFRMFGSLVESRREPRSRLRLLTLQIAVGVHAVVLTAIGIEKWLEVPSIPEPAVRTSFAQIATPPPPPPAPPPKPAAAKVVPKTVAPVPQEVVQPQQVPQEVAVAPIAEPAPSTEGVEGGVEGGVSGGVPGAAPEPMYYTLGGDATPPEPVSVVNPVYTAIAKSARIQGTVMLEIIILPDGTVADEIKTLRQLPMGLTEAAIAAVRRRRYKPAMLKNGVAVPFLMTVSIHFRLAD